MRTTRRTRRNAGQTTVLAGAVIGALTLVSLQGAPASSQTTSPPTTSGKVIYEQNCGSCHDGGFKGWMTGAPKLGKYKKWEPFLKKGADKMTHNVITGDEKHEKNGDCESCTAEEIRSAVNYIVSKTKK